MRAISYFRLMQGDTFVGFRREIVEYLPAGKEEWTLKSLEYDEDVLLTEPPVGILYTRRANLGRP